MTEHRQPDQDFGDRLLDRLLQIPALDDYDGRTSLLRGLPREAVGGIRRDPARIPDLNNIVTAAEGWGQLASGQWPLVIIAQNALRLARGIQPGAALDALLAEVEGKSRPVVASSNYLYSNPA